MLAVTFKSLWSRRLRLVTTGVAVSIGVAFMAGAMVLTDTVKATFDSLFADVSAGVDVRVRRQATVEVDGFEVRGRLDDALVDTVQAVDGVAAAVGVVEGFTQISGSDGEPLGQPGRGAPTLGMSWIADEELNPFHVVEGRAPAADNELVIDRASAKDGRLRVGDTVHVDAARPVPPLTLVGIVAFGRADSPAGASIAGYTPAAAQRYVAEPGQVDAIVVRGAPDVAPSDLRVRVAAVLPEGSEALTGAEVAKENQDGIREGLAFFSTFLLTFALIALFVGSFIIYNTFSILVAQRTREVALLRAVGASRRQVVGSVVVESAAVGVAASALGLAAGIGVAGVLKVLLAAVGFDLPAGGTVLTARTVVVSLVTGSFVTMAAAVVPARRAARIAPVAALTGAAAEPTDHLGRRLVAGGAITAAGTAIGIYGLSAQIPALVGAGGVVMFIGLATLAPVIARPAASALGRPLPAVRGVAGALARENAMRNPRRTAATASALMIGVALVGFIAIFATSAKAAVSQTVGERFTGDFAVESGTFGFGGLEPGLAKEIARLPEVAAASAVRVALAKVDGEGVAAQAVDPGAYAEIIDLEVVQGAITALGVDGLAVRDTVAAAKGWTVGDTIPAEFAATGQRPLVLQAVYRADVVVPRYLISTAAHDANFGERFDMAIYVKKAEGVPADDAKRAIAAVLAAQGNAELVDRQGYIDAAARDVNQLLALIYALLALAIVVAVLGIANTLALSIHERTRELGLLRAVGMTRSQLRSSIRWESVIIALLGTTLGLAIGAGFAWAMVRSLADDGFTAFVIPYDHMLVVALLAGACGVLAAIRPARRAARIDVLTAIAAP